MAQFGQAISKNWSHIYLNRVREAYAIQHPQRRNMFEDAERRRYGRVLHQYVTNQPIIASGPSFLPSSGNTRQEYPSASTEQLRATTRGKEQQLLFISTRAPDIVSYESFNRESSATKSNINT